MIFYDGINRIVTQFRQLWITASSWFNQLDLSDYISILPVNFRPFVAAFLVILLAMAAVGVIKKLSIFM